MSHQRRASWAKYQTEEGYEYYYDEDTRNSQWERPCDYSSDQDIAAVADPDSSNGDYGTYYPAAAEVGEVGKGVVTEGEDTTTQSYLSTNEILLEENPQQEYAEYYQDQYYGGTTYEDFYFEYDTTANLFDELARLTLFQSLPPQEIASLRSGHWCHVSCRKLEVHLPPSFLSPL
jgi:Tfp pilus tip-associated adhesin PilY1